MTKLSRPSNNTSARNLTQAPTMNNNNSSSAFRFGSQAPVAKPMIKVDLNLNINYLTSPTKSTILAKTHNGMVMCSSSGENPFIRFRLKSETQGYTPVIAIDPQGNAHNWDYDQFVEEMGIDEWDIQFIADLPELEGVELSSYRSISLYIPAESFSDEGIREYNGANSIEIRCHNVMVQLNHHSISQGIQLSAEDILAGVQVNQRRQPFALARTLKPSKRQLKKAEKREEANELRLAKETAPSVVEAPTTKLGAGFNSVLNAISNSVVTPEAPVQQEVPAQPSVSIVEEEEFVELEIVEGHEESAFNADDSWFMAMVQTSAEEVPSGTGFGQQEVEPAKTTTKVDLCAEDTLMDDNAMSAEQVKQALAEAKQRQAQLEADVASGKTTLMDI